MWPNTKSFKEEKMLVNNAVSAREGWHRKFDIRMSLLLYSTCWRKYQLKLCKENEEKRAERHESS